MNPWLRITIIHMLCYCARIFTRPFTVQSYPAGKQLSLSAPALLLPKRAEKEIQNEIVKWLQN